MIIAEGVVNIKVLLVSIDAKNIHKPLSPWCIKAFCDKHTQSFIIEILEHNINDNIGDIISHIYINTPDLIGLSCYIWNIELILKIAKSIRKLIPSCLIVLGGPEVSFEIDLDKFPFADYIIQGPGEESFCELAENIKKGNKPPDKIIAGSNRTFTELPSPFTDEYFDSFQTNKMSSIENQLIYYESSRGCPFSCSFCLSSATQGVQALPVLRVKEDLLKIISRGAKCIKFVDRTFNADKTRAREILKFIHGLDTDCTFHFEVAADLFDEEMLHIIAAMPVSRVQFETGIQSVNQKTLNTVCRKTDIEKALINIKKLTDMKNCHIHIDLIAGLPFDTPETFAQAIDSCLTINPQMLQIGFLKMLKGSSIRKTSEKYDYIYADYAPYEVFKSNTMTCDELIHLKAMGKVIDKFYNSGMYRNSLQYAAEKLFKSQYEFFSELSYFCRNKGNIKVSLKNSYTILLDFLLNFGDEKEAEHYIKLDCLTFDIKGMLPDRIKQYRDKMTESELKNKTELGKTSIRVESFEFDNEKRLFVYDNKDPISKGYRVFELNESITETAGRIDNKHQ